MKRLMLFLLLTFSSQAASDIRVFWWQESKDEKTGENLSGFFIAPLAVKAFYEAMAAGDEKKAEALASKLSKDAWSFVLLLRGEETTFSKARIIMREGTICGDYPELSDGSVTVDRKSSTVRITLKVSRDGKLSDFVGNGEYVWTKKPAP